MKISDQQKDKMPATNTFILWPVVFLAIVFLCRATTQEVDASVHHEQPVNILHWIGLV